MAKERVEIEDRGGVYVARVEIGFPISKGRDLRAKTFGEIMEAVRSAVDEMTPPKVEA